MRTSPRRIDLVGVTPGRLPGVTRNVSALGEVHAEQGVDQLGHGAVALGRLRRHPFVDNLDDSRRVQIVGDGVPHSRDELVLPG